MKSAEYLLLEISCRDTKEEKLQAEKSLNEFVAEYGLFLKKLIYSQAGTDESKYKDLYQLFILDIWEKADQFNSDKCPDDKEDVKIKKWLNYRMKAVIRKYRNELVKNSTLLQVVEFTPNTYLPPEEEEEMFDNVDFNTNRLKIAMIKDKVLNKRELDILKTTLEFNGQIPEEIRIAICKEYNISEATIRTIRYRAKKKIGEFIKEKSKLIIQ